MHLILLLFKHFFRKKLFLTFLTLNNSALLKTNPIIGLYRYTPHSPVSIPFLSRSHPICRYQKKTQIKIYSLFLRKLFGHNYQLVWDANCKMLALISLHNVFTMTPFLFSSTSENRHPHFGNLFDFPVGQFVSLTFDSPSVDKSLELPPSLLVNLSLSLLTLLVLIKVLNCLLPYWSICLSHF